ncbi:2-dehydropantoate 2-reductase [compost metagenome]
MKILVFGRGVISTQYAWALSQSGNTVTFFVRKGKAELLGETVSLNIYDARKKLKGELIKDEWRIRLIEELSSDHEYDLIFVSVQHYQLKSVADFLADKIGNATLFLFNNIWNEPLEVMKAFPRKQLVFGFPVAGGGFDSNGVLNGAFLGKVTIGTDGTTAPSEREAQVLELFKGAGFKVTMVSDFRSWLFGHFAVNAAIHLETLKSQADKPLTDLLRSPRHWRNVIANGKELIPLLEARQVDLKYSPDLKIFKLPPWLLGLLMKVMFKFMPAIKIIFSGHNNEYELKSYSRDVMETADELGISLPGFQAFRNLYKIK